MTRMAKLKKYAIEIKQSIETSTSQDIYNIILICRDAKSYIARNAADPKCAALAKSFADIEALAENIMAEGQQHIIDNRKARSEKIKTIIGALDKYFETVEV
jgi:hypothetical protein